MGVLPGCARPDGVVGHERTIDLGGGGDTHALVVHWWCNGAQSVTERTAGDETRNREISLISEPQTPVRPHDWDFAWCIWEKTRVDSLWEITIRFLGFYCGLPSHRRPRGRASH